MVSSRAASGAGAGKPKSVPDLTLLRSPRVFTLAIVWESPQVRRGGI